MSRMKKLQQRAAVSLLLAFVPFGGTNAFAAPAEDHEEAASYETPVVAVTAQRIDRTELDTAATMTIITADQLKDTGAANVYEALERVPGINSFSYYQGGETSGGMFSRLNIRGLDKGTLVLIDGAPANMLNYNTMVNAVPIDSVERIEIVKGAGSVMYGAEAMAGVINIITKKPQAGETSGNVELRWGSRERGFGLQVETEPVSVNYQHDYRKQMNGLARIFPQTTRGKERLSHTKDKLFASFRLSDALTGNYTYNSSEFGYRETKLTKGRWKESLYHYNTKQQRIGLSYDDKKHQIKSNFAWIDQSIRPLEGDSTTNTDSSSLHFDTQKVWNFRDGLDSLVGGVEFHREGHQKHHSTNQGSLNRDSYALFASYTRQINDRFAATLGVREHIVRSNAYDRAENIFLPQLQTVYNMTMKSSWYVNIGKSFEMPAANSAFYSAKVSTRLPLKPQVGWNYETGLKFGDKKETLRIALFQMDIDNQFKWVKENTVIPGGDKNTSIQINRAKFRNVGLEVEYAKDLSKEWRIRLGGSWSNPRAKDASDSPWVQSDARLQYFAGLTYEKDKWRICTDWYATAKRQGAYYLNATGGHVAGVADHRIPNRIEGNLTMRYRPSSDHTIEFGIFNLLDRENAVNEYENLGYPRNYRLSYTYHF